MKQLKKWKQIVVIICSMLVLLLCQSAAMAATDYEFKPKVTDTTTGAHVVYTAGSDKKSNLIFELEMSENDLNSVNFVFEGNYFKVIDGTANVLETNGAAYHANVDVNGKTAVFNQVLPVMDADGKLTPDKQTVQFTFTVVGTSTVATTSPVTDNVIITYSGNKVGRVVPLSISVEPDLIDFTESELSIIYDDYAALTDKSKGVGYVTVKLRDKFGNPSTKMPDNQALFFTAKYLNQFADIICSDIAADTDNYYKLTALISDTMSLTVTGDMNKLYTLSLGFASKSLTPTPAEIPTVNNAFGTGLSIPVNFALATVTLQGNKVTTHDEGQISVTWNIGPSLNLTGKTIELQMPNTFKVKQQGENGRVLLDATSSQVFLDVLDAPGEGTYDYLSGDLAGVTLYIDDVPYPLTNFAHSEIVVTAATLDIIIENELDFRHGTADAIPTKLDFTISGISNQAIKMVFTLPAAADTATGIQFLDGTKTMQFDRVFAKTEKFTLPIKFNEPIDSWKNTNLNEVYPITIITYDSNGRKMEQSSNLRLRYRITDDVVKADQTDFNVNETWASGNQCSVTVDVTLNHNDCNGRGIYLWITDEEGKVQNIKDRFDIKLADETLNYLILKNTELAEVEGHEKGDRNVFRLFPAGTIDFQVNSILDEGPVLGTTTFKVIITSSLDGNYKLAVGTGRNAKEALLKSVSGLSSPFVFLSEDDLPVVNIGQTDTIYYNYDSYAVEGTALAAPGPGYLKVSIAKLGMEENNDVIYLKVPNGFTVKAGYGEIDTAAGISYLTLTRKNATAIEDNGDKETYHWEIPITAINKEELLGDDAVPVEDRSILSTEFAYYRGADMQSKQGISGLQIYSDLVFKYFQPNLNEMMKVTGLDEALTINTARQWSIEPTTLGYKSEVFKNSKGIIFWFSTMGNEAAVVPVSLTIADDANTSITAGTENRYQLFWKEENSQAVPGTLDYPLTVTFPDNGTYQLNIELMNEEKADPGDIIVPLADDANVDSGDNNDNDADKVITVLNTPTSMYTTVAVKSTAPETPEVNETWNLALKVDGTDYTAVNHVYTVTGKKIGDKIAVTGKLTDKAGKPLAGVNVTISGEVWTYTGNTTAITSAEGEFAFEISAAVAGTPHILTMALNSNIIGNSFATSYSMQITVTDGTIVEPVTKYTVDKVKTVAKVAVDDMAVVYLEVYDENDDLISITSNAQARGIFKEIEFRDLPDRSDLYDSNIYVKANNGGIEVYFYPDYRGDYHIRMITNSGDGQVITASFEAVYQGEIVDIELIYPEKTLGIGETSSPAQIITYDKNGVEAEVAIVKSGWGYYYQGSAAQSMDAWGRVTLKDNERYIGSTVTASIYHERAGLTASYTFNVDDKSHVGEDDGFLDISGIVLPDDYGAVGQTNQYQFYLVDRNGFTVQLSPGQMSRYNGAEAEVTVYSKPYGATVNAYISSNGQSLEDNGFGYLYVDCNKEGSVRLNVRLKIYTPRTVNNYTYNQYQYYSKTIEIQMKEKANANQAISTDKTLNQNSGAYNTSVAIFLGTNHYRVNMNEKIGEAKPIFRDGKIMVPVQTLTDGLGGKYEYNQEKKTITMKVGSDWAVATLGSNIIKTNYGSVYSDVVPFVEGGYTYLPLRAAAEVMGCKVESVSDLNGSVIGAVFLR